MAWINEIVDPLPSTITKIYWAKSGKGLILESESYSVFIWKDSKTSTHLIQALTTYIEKGTLKKPIEIIPDKSVKEGFKILPKAKPFKNPSHEWRLSGDLFYYGLPSLEVDEEINPFL